MKLNAAWLTIAALVLRLDYKSDGFGTWVRAGRIVVEVSWAGSVAACIEVEQNRGTGFYYSRPDPPLLLVFHRGEAVHTFKPWGRR